MRKVTIEDISRQTGLSRGTISRALNDRPDISAKTRQRVLDACTQLNYVPSHAARTLATGRTFAASVIVQDLRTAASAALLRGVISQAEREGYAVHVVEAGPDGSITEQRLRSVTRERIDCVVLATALPASILMRLREQLGDRPIASCEPLDGVAADIFSTDEREAGRLAARRLLEAGLTRVMYVRNANSSDDARRAGFADVCRSRGLDAEGVTVTIPAGQGRPGELDATLRPRLDGVAGIAAADDYLATDLMLSCTRAGRRPGEDIAIIGQGNEPIASRVHPSLTTIDFSTEEIGRRALSGLIERVNGSRKEGPEHTIIAPTLIERASTAHLRT